MQISCFHLAKKCQQLLCIDIVQKLKKDDIVQICRVKVFLTKM